MSIAVQLSAANRIRATESLFARTINAFCNKITLKADKEQTPDIGDAMDPVRCSDHWLRSVPVIVRLAHRELVWIEHLIPRAANARP